MKKMRKYLRLCGLALLLPTLAGCSFMRQETPLAIEEVTWKYNEQGGVDVKITYNNEDQPATEFTIPKGDPGADAVSITGIDYDVDQETQTTTINIYFTDEELNTSFPVPKGVGIVSTDSTHDEDTGITTIIFHFSDGTESKPIEIYDGEKGEKGDTGNGIANIESEEVTVGGEKKIKVTVTFTDEVEPYVFYIRVPEDGEDGISVSSIKTEARKNSETGEIKYYFIIKYSDNSVQEVPFTPTAWHIVNEKPLNSFGNNGDFAFNDAQDIIYVKENNVWRVAIDFHTNDSEYTVTFNVNGAGASLVGSSTLTVKYGQTCYSSSLDLPVAVRPNYKFLGWTTTSNENPGPQFGYFTNLTPVVSDMELFAVWAPLYQVTLSLGAEDAYYVNEEQVTEFYFEEGHTFQSIGETLPVPVRDGYTFMGWSIYPDYHVTAGYFTALTPIFSHLTLSAIWSPLE